MAVHQIGSRKDREEEIELPSDKVIATSRSASLLYRILILATIRRCSTQLNRGSITRTTYQTPPRSRLSLGSRDRCLDLEPDAFREKKWRERERKKKRSRSQTNLYSHGRSAISFLFSSSPLPSFSLDLRAFYSTFPIPDDEREKREQLKCKTD